MYLIYDSTQKAYNIVSSEDMVYRVNDKTIFSIEVSEKDIQNIEAGTHEFDVSTKSIVPISSIEPLEFKRQQSIDIKTFLRSTDWKVLRHLREKALGLETSISEEEYLELESKRHMLSKSI
jgi:hypothetical protein